MAVLRLTAYVSIILFLTYQLIEMRTLLFLAIAPATLLVSLTIKVIAPPLSPIMAQHLVSLWQASLICLIITAALFWFANTYLVT